MRLTAILVLLSITLPCTAGEFNRVLNIGDDAPTWAPLPGVDGKNHSSGELAEAKAVVVAFTCNSCPYAVDAEDRLIKLANDFKASGVALVAINVNLIEEDALPAMKEKAADKKFPFTYLFDASQQVAKDFGAKTTPEFFLINGSKKIAYMGSMDDSPDGKSVGEAYLRDAIEAVLKDEVPKVAETVPIGCRIRMKRVRGGR